MSNHLSPPISIEPICNMPSHFWTCKNKNNPLGRPLGPGPRPSPLALPWGGGHGHGGARPATRPLGRPLGPGPRPSPLGPMGQSSSTFEGIHIVWETCSTRLLVIAQGPFLAPSPQWIFGPHWDAPSSAILGALCHMEALVFATCMRLYASRAIMSVEQSLRKKSFYVPRLLSTHIGQCRV